MSCWCWILLYFSTLVYMLQMFVYLSLDNKLISFVRPDHCCNPRLPFLHPSDFNISTTESLRDNAHGLPHSTQWKWWFIFGNFNWVNSLLFFLNDIFLLNFLYVSWPKHLFMISILFYTFVQGRDFRSQFQLGNGALFGANYIQVNDLGILFLTFKFKYD